MSEMKDRLGQLIEKAATTEDVAKLVAAEQVLIGYCFDGMKAAMIKRLAGEDTYAEMDHAGARRAVEVIGQICADLGEEDLFKGDVANVADLYVFASEITDLEAAAKSIGERVRRQQEIEKERRETEDDK